MLRREIARALGIPQDGLVVRHLDGAGCYGHNGADDAAMDAAECIGCGACVAAGPNGAANLFTGAKVTHLNLLPQGQAERYSRVEAMVETMDSYFGSCTNHGECQEACPKEISIDFIAYMNRDYVKAQIKNRKLTGQAAS